MLLEMLRQPLKIAAFGRMLADLHLEMHRQSAADLPLQSEMVGGAIYNAKLLSDAQRAAALDALRRLPPGDRLCHNDFHPENVLISAKGPLVIDWMTARRGNPWADVARTHLLISIGRPLDTNPLKLLLLLVARSVFVNAYHRRYREVKPDPEGQLQAWIPVMAAARLNENIKEETAALLAIVNKAF